MEYQSVQQIQLFKCDLILLHKLMICFDMVLAVLVDFVTSFGSGSSTESSFSLVDTYFAFIGELVSDDIH